MSANKRITACIEYCGVNYSGWQYQANAASVQDQVEKAIARVANEKIRVIAAGRTDTGVHGIGQIIHFDTHSIRHQHAWKRGVNTHLPNDISLLWTHPVDELFHARFSALGRSYRYVILNRDVSPSYLHGRVTWHYMPLAVELMQEAATALIGQHDFSAFRAAGCQSKNPVKEIRQVEINQSGPWIWIDISADGFLHHMVRNIVGALFRIGEKQEPVEWLGEVLAESDRKHAGTTAAADGLYFVGVEYDLRFNLPPSPPACRFW
jgi:tRNA pseudouridine38-40 synthase